MALIKGSSHGRGYLPALAAFGELLGTVTCTCALVLALALPLARWQPISAEHVHMLLAAAMATIGGAAAILGTVAARLLGDRRMSWLAAAVGSYCLVVLPLTIVRPSLVLEGPAPQAAWLAGQVIVVGLLVVSLRPPALLGPWTAGLVVGAGAFAAQAASELAAYLIGPSQVVVIPSALTATVLAGWGVVGLALLLAGYRDGSAALVGIALGLTMIACVQMYWATAEPGVRAAVVPFDQLRLLGLIVVFAGMLALARRALGVVRIERQAHEEEMRLAAVHLRRAAEQAAERDHELRNGVAGLSGITTLLSSSASSDEREGLRSAMLGELARLAAMIDGVDRDGDRTRVDVAAELHNLVHLRRATGAQIDLELGDGLCAAGSPAVFAQVLSNLLANCARHAAGTPVSIRAERRGPLIVVTVRDGGPGIPPGQEVAVLERGVRDPVTGGSGLGLYLCRRLLAGEGAELRIVPTERGTQGCTVIVELPVVPTSPRVPVAREVPVRPRIEEFHQR